MNVRPSIPTAAFGRSRDRLERKLAEAIGPTIFAELNDPSVIEIMLNPDGRLFVERLGQDMTPIGSLDPQAAETVIGAVAHALGTEVTKTRPIVSGELPIGGHRFEGLLTPVVASPVFCIRKRATRLFSLADYVSGGILTPTQVNAIRCAVRSRLNVVVAGGTGSGKTTLTNAILAEIVDEAPDQRLVILEDTAEIQCSADNVVHLHTSEMVDMGDLLKSTMRLRPDRIIVGEVRDGAALTLLKAWNTGHPGGVATVHANSARSALARLEQLVCESIATRMQDVIGEAVDIIIHIQRTATGRLVRDILRVDDFTNGQYRMHTYDPGGTLEDD